MDFVLFMLLKVTVGLSYYEIEALALTLRLVLLTESYDHMYFANVGGCNCSPVPRPIHKLHSAMCTTAKSSNDVLHLQPSRTIFKNSRWAVGPTQSEF